MRATIKRLGEALLVGTGLARRGRRRRARAGEVLILGYHNVVPDRDAALEPGALHLAFSDFRRHLDMIERNATVVGLEGVDRNPGAGTGAKPRVVLTFDDAYVGAVELALPEIERRGLSATVFVCPGLMGAEGFWWDVFDLDDPGERVFHDLAADHAPVHQGLRAEGVPEIRVSRWRRPAGPELLGPYLTGDGRCVRLGGHTWTHPSLPALGREQVVDQLRATWDWLQSEVHSPSEWMAYPYGHASAEAARVAESIGYRGALLIEGGWMRPGRENPFRVPRLNIPAGVSDAGFELRLAGLIER